MVAYESASHLLDISSFLFPAKRFIERKYRIIMNSNVEGQEPHSSASAVPLVINSQLTGLENETGNLSIVSPLASQRDTILGFVTPETNKLSTSSKNAPSSVESVQTLDTSASGKSIRSSDRAESIRARLRNQEQRLASLMSTKRYEVKEVVDDQVIVVKDTLKQVEAEKAELEQKLEYLQLRQAEEDAKRYEEHALQAQTNNMDNIRVSDEHDAFLRVKLAGIQKGFQEQTSKISTLQDALRAKDAEIDRLHLEISNKLSRIINLEYDIQCHSIHYTEYSKLQYKLGNDAMNEINTLLEIGQQSIDDESISSPITLPAAPTHDYDHVNSGSSWTSPLKTKPALHPRRAKKLITKLLSDLDHLEELYKNEKLSAMEMSSRLEKENEELKAMVLVLEKEKAQNDAKAKARDKKKRKSTQIDVDVETLRKRIDMLEAMRFIYRKQIMQLEEEMKNLRKEHDNKGSKYEMEVARLTLALDAVQLRCRTLETDLIDDDEELELTANDGANHIGLTVEYPKSKSSFISKGGDQASRTYATVEQKIVQCYNDIARLEAESEIKDMQNADMKKEICELRAKDISAGNCQGEAYSELDVRILSSIENKVTMMKTIVCLDEQNKIGAHSDITDQSGATAEICSVEASTIHDESFCLNQPENVTTATMSAIVADLRNQLSKVQDELAKKDQELTIEKARSSCMAANLLDRIESLDRQNEDEDDNQLREDDEEDESDTSSNLIDSSLKSPTDKNEDEKEQKLKRRPKEETKKERKKIFGRIPLRFYL